MGWLKTFAPRPTHGRRVTLTCLHKAKQNLSVHVHTHSAAINDRYSHPNPKVLAPTTKKHQFSKVIQNNIYEQGKNPINGSLSCRHRHWRNGQQCLSQQQRDGTCQTAYRKDWGLNAQQSTTKAQRGEGYGNSVRQHERTRYRRHRAR